jgi:hypothetical protein
MEITTEMIKELRAATGAGILDCRKALTEADGDFPFLSQFLGPGFGGFESFSFGVPIGTTPLRPVLRAGLKRGHCGK